MFSFIFFFLKEHTKNENIKLLTVGRPSDWVRSGHFVNHRLYTDCKASSATVATPVVQTGFFT